MNVGYTASIAYVKNHLIKTMELKIGKRNYGSESKCLGVISDENLIWDKYFTRIKTE